MNFLITGASGLYGSKLAQLAASQQHQIYSIHNQHQAIFGKAIQVDITNLTQVESVFKEINPDIVVHAAALSDVDKCEQNRELAWKINVDGTTNIAQTAKVNNTFVLHISTDYVFDGEKGNYIETDLASPINFYGYTKLKAEEQIKKILSNYCIARTSVVYGSNLAAGKINFALWLLNKLRKGETIKVFTDQWNSPTLNTNLTHMTLEIIERRLNGTFHISGATRISRYDFAIQLAKTFNLDTGLLIPASSKEIPFPAKRPKDSSLNTSKAQQTLKNKPLTIQEGLEKLKTEF